MLSKATDEQLLEKLKAEDLDAFKEVFVLYRKWLMVSALSILDDEDDANDIVQELFIDLWHKQLYKGIDTSLKNYLYGACRNRCLNLLAKQHRTQHWKDGMGPVKENFIELTQLENKELHDQLSRAVNHLPPRSAKVLTLTYFEGKSRREIAKDMQISPSTVKHQLARAVRLMRTILKNNSGEIDHVL